MPGCASGKDPLAGRGLRFRKTRRTEVEAQIELGKLLALARDAPTSRALANRAPSIATSLTCGQPARRTDGMGAGGLVTGASFLGVAAALPHPVGSPRRRRSRSECRAPRARRALPGTRPTRPRGSARAGRSAGRSATTSTKPSSASPAPSSAGAACETSHFVRTSMSTRSPADTSRGVR